MKRKLSSVITFQDRWLFESIGIELERVMKTAKITRNELGEKCGWARERVDRVINGNEPGLTIDETTSLFSACGADLILSMKKA